MSESGTVMCTNCTAGTIANAGNTACDSCPAGRRSDAEADACTGCAPDAYSTGGQEDCIACGDGDVTNAAQSECDACGTGYYERSVGTCAACPAGYYSQLTAMGAPAACTACPPGQFEEIVVGAAGQFTCKACPADYYDDGSEATLTACKHCGAGSVTSDKIVCGACPAGQFEDAVQDPPVCVACDGVGGRDVAEGTGNTACVVCPEGQVVPIDDGTPDRTRCAPCAAGHYCPDAGTQLACPAGRFGFDDVTGAATLADGCPGACAAGAYALNRAAGVALSRAAGGERRRRRRAEAVVVAVVSTLSLIHI